MLGVRTPQDIATDAAGMVNPGTGGLSVAPDSFWNLPNHRRPRGMLRGSTGHPLDRVYAVASTSIPETSLRVRADPRAPTKHAFIEPAAPVRLSGYEEALAGTRPLWTQVWP
jgi:hypothetical protein